MKTIKIFSILSIIIFLGSCRERMDINLKGSEIRLIVNGKITTDDSIVKIKLTKSADFFSNNPVEAVSDAFVTISDGTTTDTLYESLSKLGFYESLIPIKGIPGRTYQLKIKNVTIGNEVTEYTASSFMPEVRYMDSVYLLPLTPRDFAPPKSQFSINALATDPAETQDNYLFRLYKNGILLTDSIDQLSFSNDEFFNGTQITALAFFIRYDYGPGAGGGSVTILDSIKNGDMLTLEMDCITKEYLSFVSDIQSQRGGSSPFSGPPANISTNIFPKENAAGFFAAYSLTRKSIIYNAKK